MHTQYRPVPYARLNAFHGPKRQVLGNHAGVVPPAWRVTPGMLPPGAKGKQVAQGIQDSKIFLSRLPLDVSESEVEVSLLNRNAEVRRLSGMPWVYLL